MRPGDLVRFKREYLDPEEFGDDQDLIGAIGIITGIHDGNRHGTEHVLFEILINGAIAGGFDYEIELIE
jgi:hypothetical protein